MRKTEMIVAERTIGGDAEHVARALDTQVRLGRLVTSPARVRPVRQADGTIRVTVALREERPISWRRQHPTLAPILTALTFALGVLAAVAAGIAMLIHFLAGILPTMLGLTALALIVAGLINRAGHSGACTGLHCDGCKESKC